MSEKNSSFVLEKPGKVIYEDRPVPETKDPHDVLVQVKYTGICGSDVHYWTDGQIGPFKLEKPMILGHESSGTIHSVGSAVNQELLSAGQRVAIEPGIPCRRCHSCKSGRYNLCVAMRFAATPPYDGTLTNYYLVPADFVYPLPAHVSLQEGALLEPASVAVHSVLTLAQVGPGARVVVFGCGPVGLLCMGVARAVGARTVVGVDVNEERLQFARGYAATHVFLTRRGEGPEDAAQRLCEECGAEGGLQAVEGWDEGGADAVLEATGAEPCIQMGIHVAKKGGVYVQAGLGNDEVKFPIGVLSPKELVVKGCFRYATGDYEKALELVSSGKLNVKSLISREVSFTDAEEAFKATKNGEGIKILIKGPST